MQTSSSPYNHFQPKTKDLVECKVFFYNIAFLFVILSRVKDHNEKMFILACIEAAIKKLVSQGFFAALRMTRGSIYTP